MMVYWCRKDDFSQCSIVVVGHVIIIGVGGKLCRYKECVITWGAMSALNKNSKWNIGHSDEEESHM